MIEILTLGNEDLDWQQQLQQEIEKRTDEPLKIKHLLRYSDEIDYPTIVWAKKQLQVANIIVVNFANINIDKINHLLIQVGMLQGMDISGYVIGISPYSITDKWITNSFDCLCQTIEEVADRIGCY